MCSPVANLVGVTSKTGIKVVGSDKDTFLIRYDVNRPLLQFYRFHHSLETSEARLTFEETVNYKQPVLGLFVDGDELQIHTSGGIFVSAFRNRQCYKFVSSDSLACCLAGGGVRTLVRRAFGGLEVSLEGGGRPLCRIPDAPSPDSVAARPVLCRISIREKSSREGRPGSSLPGETFHALFGTSRAPVLVLGLPDGRVLSLRTGLRPQLPCRLRQPVVEIYATVLLDEKDRKVPVLIALGRRGQVAAVTAEGVRVADAPAPFDRVSLRDDSAEILHVSRGSLWSTQLRLDSHGLVARSRTTARTAVVDAQPLPGGRVAVLTENGHLLSRATGESACDPEALMRSVTEIATNLHRARQLLNKRQAHLRALSLGAECVTVSAERDVVPGGPVAIRFRYLPRDCGWSCCVTLCGEGGGIVCRCAPSTQEGTEEVTLWLEDPRGSYSEARPWLLLAPGAPLALPRIPLVADRPRGVARLTPAFTIASATNIRGTLSHLDEIVDTEKSKGPTSIVVRETGPVSVDLDCGSLRSFAALHCAVAHRLLESLRCSEVPSGLRFQVLPACAAAVRMLERREGEVLEVYRRWRRTLADLVLA